MTLRQVTGAQHSLYPAVWGWWSPVLVVPAAHEDFPGEGDEGRGGPVLGARHGWQPAAHPALTHHL